jgi:two-component system response regulator PilR (NtrC family)
MEAGNIILPENLVMPDTFEKDLGVLDDIPDEGIDLNGKMAEIEKTLIEKALQKTAGSKTKAAEFLGVTLDSLRYRLEKLDIN